MFDEKNLKKPVISSNQIQAEEFNHGKNNSS
jgi:hypothetical protein